MRNRELEHNAPKAQVWRAKQTTDKEKVTAEVQMAFLLPSEFMAPTNKETKVYLDFDKLEYEEIVTKLMVI